MEFKGTEEKWELTTDGEANFYIICTEKNWLMKIQQNGEISIQEQEANAKLIAAAPEIFELLKESQRTIQSLRLSMSAHPDCVENSEFADYVDLADTTEEKINELLNQTK